MDNFIEFRVSEWGMTLSSAPIYVNLSWGMVIVIIGAYLARRIIKHKRSK